MANRRTILKQEIRIIGGLYRGKKITFPNSEGLRPTADRVKETLFNWLMHDIKEARCLDAFAGSGALGFEAFSRGAACVDLIEQSPLVYKHLHQIISQFNTPKLQLVNADSLVYLQQTKKQYDVIFLDPPFAQDYIPRCLASIIRQQVLVKGGLIYIESPHILTLDNQQWELMKLKKAGQVFYGLYQYTGPNTFPI